MDINQNKQGNRITYTVYIQDTNGNPPIEGSTFSVVKNPDGESQELKDIEYSDSYTYKGTWRDKSDLSTDNPYVISTTVEQGDSVEFTFTPACKDSAPGCSGDEETRKFDY